jgi:serine/threonine-protein kinase
MPRSLASHAPPSHAPGEVIAGRYTLRARLGEGAMGVVWTAHCHALDVDVALKMLRPELAGTAAVERMAREARTAAQLGHPALVRVIDFGNAETGEPFMAMELLEGEELNARLAREHRLSAVDAIGLILPVIEGLAIAHEKGIVHRDVKPENIFISVDGRGRVQPKVLDFGVAKLAGDGVSKLTGGGVVGSPRYLAPEQAEGQEDIDRRADVWAIGVVLYECITGAPPFGTDNYNALLQSIKRDPPAPMPIASEADAALWVLLQRCLMKDRSERWDSMWELGEALALWLFERGIRVDAAARSLRHGWLESGITGVKLIVPSDAPEPPTPVSRRRRAPAPVPEPPSAPDTVALVPMSKAFALPAVQAGTATRTGRAWWWLGIATCAASIAAYVVANRAEPALSPHFDAAAAKPVPSVLAPLGLGSLEQTVPPSMIPREPPAASAAPVASASASAKPKPAKSQRSPTRAPARKPSREFGF